MDYLNKFVENFGIEILKCGPIPNHVAFICDGNRRYAREIGITKRDSWIKGTEPINLIIDTCEKLGIKELSFFLFGIENLKRSKDEIDTLYGIFKEYLEKGIADNKPRVRAWVTGAIELAPEDFQIEAAKLFEQSSKKKDAILDVNLNLFYSSMFEFGNSIDRLYDCTKNGVLKPDEITINHFENCLWTNGRSNVDILVRTSGEIRFSDYLLWQCNYAHLAFVDYNWPELNLFKFFKIIFHYQMESIKKTANNCSKEKIESKFKEFLEKKEVERFKEFLKNPICKFNEKFKF